MIIVFFAGLIIMASAGSVSDISNIAYLHLVCNVIGGIMMGGSTFFLFKEETRKKDELKLLVEKLSGKEEHENEINVLNAIESVLRDYGETLGTIDENQKKIIEGVRYSNEIKDSIILINKQLKDGFDTLGKQVEIISNSIQNIGNSVDTLHTDYTEYRNQEENNFSLVIEKVTSILEIIQLQSNQLEKSKNEIIETLVCINQRIEGINLLPEKINESVEGLITKFETTVDSIRGDYKYLTEDIDDQEKARTKKFNLIISEIRDSFEDSNEEMVEEIKKLAEQYESFEKMISTMINQMSHMAEEDIKVMKGFLNG